MLEAVDGPVRMMIFGEFVLILTVMARSGQDRLTFIAVTGLITTVTAYLGISGPWPDLGPVLEPLLIGLATLIPFMLWNLAWRLFDDDFVQRPWHLGIVALVYVISAGISFRPELMTLETMIRTMARIAGIAVLAHAVWGIYRGLSDDLIESRRKARTIAIGLSILLVVSSLAVELALSNPADRAPLEPLNAILILLTTTLFAATMLRSTDLRFPATEPGPEKPAPAPETDQTIQPSPAVRSFIDNEGLFQSGLTVSGMAEQVQMPEYRLRRTINGQMGFRNFNAFLNSHRIAAAKVRLRDPALARQPILTIAMDLGYGSLGPFNRAFREATGMTPSDWRQKQDKNSADS